MVKVEFKKLYSDTILPKKAHESDAGFDLCAHSLAQSTSGLNVEGYNLWPGQRVLIKTGFAMALPFGYEGQVRPRSGLALKHGISIVNSPGTIDAGYRNEVGVILINSGQDVFVIRKGDRIAQLVVQKLPDVEVVEVAELSSLNERELAGFGSTGV